MKRGKSPRPKPVQKKATKLKIHDQDRKIVAQYKRLGDLNTELHGMTLKDALAYFYGLIAEHGEEVRLDHVGGWDWSAMNICYENLETDDQVRLRWKMERKEAEQRRRIEEAERQEYERLKQKFEKNP